MKRLNRIPIPEQLKSRKKEILGDIKNGTMVDCVYNKLLYNSITYSKLNTEELKKKLPSITKDYQIEDLSKSLGFNVVFNINKPGYGKTFETIQWMRLRLSKNSYVLILCPKSVIETWTEQLKKYYPEHDKEHKIFITNYEQLYNEERFQKISSINWSLIVLDESHRIKSMKSKINKRVFKLNSFYRHCLTGTPIKNRPEDIAAQLKWLDQSSITNYTDFQLAFCDIIRDQWGVKPNGLTKDKVMVENLQKLLDLYCVGGKEHDITTPPNYVKVRLKMDDKVKKLYKEVEGEYDAVLQKTVIDTEKLLEQGIKVSNPIEAATRRQQLASNPQLFNCQFKNIKFEWILEWLQGTDEKVIIISKYSKTIDALENYLQSNKIKLKRIKREMNSTQRQLVVKQWSDYNFQALIGTYGVIKEGIDGLQHKCHYMIFVDREWTASDNEQAEGRINRTGQTKQCIFYILQCIGTIDIRIERVQLDKGNDAKELLQPVVEEDYE